MKTLIPLSLFLVFSGISPAFGETLHPDSKITEVTVFPDRALVTREATLELPAGKHEIQIGPLPSAIEEDSVNAKGKGASKVKLYGAQVVTEQLEGPQSDNVKALKVQIDQLQDKQREVNDREGILNEKREFLSSIKAASSEQIGKDLVTKQPSITDTTQILEMLDSELSNINQESSKLRIESRQIAEEIDKLNRELRELSGGSSFSEKTISIEVEAESAGTFTVEISYRLGAASWEPIYEARAKSDSAEVNFLLYGLIRQNTGEDWNEVKLHLSTAKPSSGGRMPETEPWFIQKIDPIVYRPRQEAKASGLLSRSKVAMYTEADTLSGADAPASMEMHEAQMVTASISQTGLAVSYDLPKKETIKSDWQPKKSPISSALLPSTQAFEISPRLSPFAYLRAKVKNSTGGALLPGKVQIFMDESFVGNSSISQIGLDEEFDLFLGIDERIKVERKQLKAKEDLSVIPSIRGRIRSIDYEYVTKIENFRGQAADIWVTDQIPVSQHDDIKVEQAFLDPKPTETADSLPGVSKWSFNLAAGTKKEIRITYRVKYPMDFEVTGL